MSDTELGTPAADAGKGKANAWTDEAKYQFLLRVIAQYKDEGKTINWGKLHMPGRTTKSLQNMWTKVNAAILELEDSGEVGVEAPKTPSKKATPRKPRAKKVKNEDDEDADGESPVKTPRKRGRPANPNKPAKKPKHEAEDSVDMDEEDDLAGPVKREADGEMEEA